jgi:hypothetical protein
MYTGPEVDFVEPYCRSYTLLEVAKTRYMAPEDEADPRLNSVMAALRWGRGVRSAIEPPPRAIGTLPAQPETKRRTRNDVALSPRALPIVKPTKARFETWDTGRRPYTSLRGATSIGPTANPSM